MASACVNKVVRSPDKFVNSSEMFPSCGWLNTGISFIREFPGEGSVVGDVKLEESPKTMQISDQEAFGPDGSDLIDFEFRLEDPVTMLSADELFSDGKMIPLQVSTMRPVVTVSTPSSRSRSPETAKCIRRIEMSNADSYLFSPKAPRCSSKWREILGLKKMYHNNVNKQDNTRETSSNNNAYTKSIKHFLHRSSKTSNSSSDQSLNLPFLNNLDSESVSVLSRHSLSSSSSGHEHDDLPRLSLDTDKPTLHPIFLLKNTTTNSTNVTPNPPRVRVVKARPVNSTGVSIDSPRMNPSGKVVFQNLERSSSSPCSFNGGRRLKHRGMERSYSANVRVTPLLNVPVCSLRGSSKSGGVLGLFSATQKKENSGGSSRGGGLRVQHSNSRTRINLT